MRRGRASRPSRRRCSPRSSITGRRSTGPAKMPRATSPTGPARAAPPSPRRPVHLGAQARAGPPPRAVADLRAAEDGASHALVTGLGKELGELDKLFERLGRTRSAEGQRLAETLASLRTAAGELLAELGSGGESAAAL